VRLGLAAPDVAERRRSYHEAVFQSGIPVRFEDERLGQWFDNRSILSATRVAG